MVSLVLLEEEAMSKTVMMVSILEGAVRINGNRVCVEMAKGMVLKLVSVGKPSESRGR